MFFGIRHSGNKTKAVYLVRTRALVLFMFSCLRSSPFLFCKHLVNFDVIGKYLVTKKFVPLVSSPRQPKLRGPTGNLNCTLFLLLLVLGQIYSRMYSNICSSGGAQGALRGSSREGQRNLLPQGYCAPATRSRRRSIINALMCTSYLLRLSS